MGCSSVWGHIKNARTLLNQRSVHFFMELVMQHFIQMLQTVDGTVFILAIHDDL